MMKLDGVGVGFAVTGSFCTFSKVVPEVEKLTAQNANVYPIFSNNAATLDTRFGKAADWMGNFEAITGKKVICTLNDAEPVGPQNLLDVLVIAPCTVNAIKYKTDQTKRSVEKRV